VFFVLTLGGGTGGGISPVIMDILSSRNLDKKYGAIIILPANNEPSIKCLNNGLESYKELSAIMDENLNSIFILDNNKGNKFSINQEFVYTFDRLINITIPDERGIIDGAELECLITQKGVSVICDVKEIDGKLTIDENIFSPFKGQSSYLGISLKDRVNIDLIQARFGTPNDTFIGYNDHANMVIATGLQIDSNRLKEMSEVVKSKQSNRDAFNNKMQEVEIPEIVLPNDATFNKKNIRESSPKKIDVDAIFGKYF
jgi:hypothetical protein